MRPPQERGSEEPTLNLAALLKATRMAGPGVRDVVWVQGCTVGCHGCANQDYLPHLPRVRMPVSRLLLHLRGRRRWIDGVSVSGGEPTEQPAAVAALLQGARELGLSTVVYTGRVCERLRDDPACRELLAYTDLLIDGPFVPSRHRADLHWRGSTNQRLLRLSDRFTEGDLAEPAASGEILLSPSRVVLLGVGTRRLVAPPDRS